MKKILVVDDSKLMRLLIVKTIREMGDFKIIEASDGNKAVQIYNEGKPALVTMDITMDDKNGVEAAKEILLADPAAKIVMITALGQEKLLRECIEAGVRDFITKPFTPERLVSVISRLMSYV